MGFRSLEYRDNGNAHNVKHLRLQEFSASARRLLSGAISVSREPYRPGGKRKREIVAKPPSGATKPLTVGISPALPRTWSGPVVLEGVKAINAR